MPFVYHENFPNQEALRWHKLSDAQHRVLRLMTRVLETTDGNPVRGSRPPPETPREKFVRLVALRTGHCLNALNNLRKLADREYYPYGERDIEAIVSFLRQQTDFTEQSFRAGREIAGGVQLPPDDGER